VTEDISGVVSSNVLSPLATERCFLETSGITLSSSPLAFAISKRQDRVLVFNADGPLSAGFQDGLLSVSWSLSRRIYYSRFIR